MSVPASHASTFVYWSRYAVFSFLSGIVTCLSRYGIFSFHYGKVTGSNCTFHQLKVGIDASEYSRIHLDDCDFEHCRYGIFIHDDPKITVLNANFSENHRGCFAMGRPPRRKSSYLEIRNLSLEVHSFLSIGSPCVRARDDSSVMTATDLSFIISACPRARLTMKIAWI